MITDVSEFKQRLQSIQQNSSVVYTTLPSSEPRLIIDANSREISIPVEFDFLAVKNDHKAETVYFEIDRYFDDCDLSEQTCVIQWSNSGDEGIAPCTELDIETFEGKIIFGWEITSDCTRLPGDISFSVRFYTIDELGNFEYNFNTLPAQSKILDTLNAYGEKEPATPSSFQVLADRVYFLEKNCITKEDLEDVEIDGGELASADGTVIVKDTGENTKDLSVAVSAASGNALVKKSDGLYVDKTVEDVFNDVVASITCGGITAGTSLHGKTAKEVLMMLLGIKEAPETVVEYILSNRIPAYSGTASSEVIEVEYQLLDTETANYSNQGFYTTTDEEGNITNAGYQLTIKGNGNADAQIISIPANAVIKMAYRYDLGGTNNWLPYTFDTTDEANYWLPGETFTAIVNGETVSYQSYVYNIDVVGGGDAITNTQYWRFEVEVMS
ncbi:MAG: hypothetical protein UH850_11180 [Paludibacteraceae bacterium]|nr:hypothetical protein [Paludibacteraceae bacterium]